MDKLEDGVIQKDEGEEISVLEDLVDMVGYVLYIQLHWKVVGKAVLLIFPSWFVYSSSTPSTAKLKLPHLKGNNLQRCRGNLG